MLLALIGLTLWVALLTVLVDHAAGAGAATLFVLIVTVLAVLLMLAAAVLELHRRLRSRPRINPGR